MNKLALIVLLSGLAACTHKRDEEDRAPATAPVVGGAVKSAAPAAPAGSNNAAPEAPGSAAPAAPAVPVGCATAVTLTCGADEVDGCTGGQTAVHVCVAKAAKAGPPCAQEIAMTCPDGQIDACLHAPPLANHHLCVVVPKAAEAK